MATTSKYGRAQHDEQIKLRALAHFASSNSATEAAKANGLPVSTVQTWVEHPDSHDFVVSVRQALRTHIAADLVTIAIAAQRAIQDRLANGDEVVTAGGKLIRRKVSAKDAAYILCNTVNLHSMMTEETKQRTAHNLKQLAADLIATLYDAKQSGKIIDATHTIENPKT